MVNIFNVGSSKWTSQRLCVCMKTMSSTGMRSSLPEVQGYGYKRGSGDGGIFSRRNWKRRFFVLDQLSFYYYSPQERGKLKGHFRRDFIASAKDSGVWKRKLRQDGYMITIVFRQREIQLAVESVEEKERWLTALNAKSAPSEEPTSTGRMAFSQAKISSKDFLFTISATKEEQQRPPVPPRPLQTIHTSHTTLQPRAPASRTCNTIGFSERCTLSHSMLAL